MRRPPQLGQKPRPLHENGTKRSKPQPAQRRRAKPWASTPQVRNARSSRSKRQRNVAAGRPVVSQESNCDTTGELTPAALAVGIWIIHLSLTLE
jgi:hypothetical protein